MNINLRQIKALVTIARVGSFTRAAGVLHISQPALTVQIHQLEQALGVRVLDRTTRSVRLTESGRLAVPALENALRGIDGVIEALRVGRGTENRLEITALPSICSSIVPRAIARFRVTNPLSPIRLVEAGMPRIVAAVKSGDAHFGVGSLDQGDPGLHVTPFITDRISVVFPAGHPLERQKTVKLPDLMEFPLIAGDPNSVVRQMLESAFTSLGYHGAPVFEANFLSTAVGMVRAGLGITVTSNSSLGRAVMTGLKSRTISHPGFSRNISILQRLGEPPSQSAAEFMEAMFAVAGGEERAGSRTNPRPKRRD